MEETQECWFIAPAELLARGQSELPAVGVKPFWTFHLSQHPYQQPVKQNHQTTHRLMKNCNHYCFKPLSIGVVFQVAMENQNKQAVKARSTFYLMNSKPAWYSFDAENHKTWCVVQWFSTWLYPRTTFRDFSKCT